jgi:hypothetical protein
MKSCPTCNSSSGLREIIYGIPDGPVDEGIYAIGGCCVSDNDQNLKCVDCGWKSESVNNTPDLGKEIQMVELQDIAKMNDAEIDSYAKQIWQKLANPKVGEIDENSKR